ncbi:hypothetical protein CPB85DRAFT_1427846 [Mucidula mucida]|nr:hypothetical protein CPB85DRAFT_1427846 [Mucidula mucida]
MLLRLSSRTIHRLPVLQMATGSRFNATLATLFKSCPSCHQPLTSSVPACNKCGTIKAIPRDVNCYNILGLPYEPHKFTLDELDLRNRFRRAQAACHPDTWTSRGADNTEVAQELSSQVNNAYQTLRNPLTRLQYLLELNGVPMDETDKIDDMEFLSDVLMARGTIEEAESIEEVDAVVEETNDKMKTVLKLTEELVAKQDWVGAKKAGIQMTYIDGVNKAAVEWKRNR